MPRRHPWRDELGSAVTTVPGDASAEADVERLVGDGHRRVRTGGRRVRQRRHRLGRQRIVDADLDQWSRVLDVNLTGPFLMIKHAARRMADGGSIVVTASLNAVQAGPGWRAYCSSKAGVAMLGRSPPWSSARWASGSTPSAPASSGPDSPRARSCMPAIVEGYEENTPMGRHAQPGPARRLS